MLNLIFKKIPATSTFLKKTLLKTGHTTASAYPKQITGLPFICTQITSSQGKCTNLWWINLYFVRTSFENNVYPLSHKYL